jgi:hypothetical protein
MVLPTKVMSTHSSLELKPTESVKRPILGLTALPGPPQSRLVAKERKSSSEGPGTNLISKSYVSPSATDSMKPNKTSSTTHNRSAIIDYTPSVSRYTPTMVNYTSPVSGYNKSSMIGNTSSMNYTPSMIDYQITPSTDFMMKSVNFTSSVSDYKSSIKVSMTNNTVPEQSTIDYTLSTSDNMSSIIDHVSQVHREQSIIHSTLPASDSTSSIIDHSTFNVREQSTMQSPINYTSSSYVSKPSISDHRSRMNGSISSIAAYKTKISGSKRTRPTTTNQYKTLLTGTMSPQTIVAPTRSKVRHIHLSLIVMKGLTFHNQLSNNSPQSEYQANN